jgi:hypothetical protein
VLPFGQANGSERKIDFYALRAYNQSVISFGGGTLETTSYLWKVVYWINNSNKYDGNFPSIRQLEIIGETREQAIVKTFWEKFSGEYLGQANGANSLFFVGYCHKLQKHFLCQATSPKQARVYIENVASSSVKWVKPISAKKQDQVTLPGKPVQRALFR